MTGVQTCALPICVCLYTAQRLIADKELNQNWTRPWLTMHTVLIRSDRPLVRGGGEGLELWSGSV